MRKLKKKTVSNKKLAGKARFRVERVTAHVAVLADPKAKERFDKEFVRLRRKSSQLMAAFRAGEQLTQRDFAIRINTRG
jgi:hypothetical protein